MGLFSSITDPLGLRKKTRKAVGIKKDPLDPFGHAKKLEKGLGEELGVDFEKFHLKSIWDDLRRNPGRMLYGSFDPLSTKMWNEALGTDYDPIINQMGGATNQRYADYIAQGGDPKIAEKAARNQQIAGTIASIYAGGALAGVAGGGAGAAGGAGAGSGTIGGLTAAMPSGATFSAGLSGMGALGTAAVTAGAAEADAEFQPEYGPDGAPWDPGPGEYLAPLTGGAERMFYGVQNPYSYGQVGFGGEQTLVGGAKGGLARVAYRRYH